MQNVIPSTCDLYRKLFQIIYQMNIDYKLVVTVVLIQGRRRRGGKIWDFWAKKCQNFGRSDGGVPKNRKGE